MSNLKKQPGSVGAIIHSARFSRFIQKWVIWMHFWINRLNLGAMNNGPLYIWKEGRRGDTIEGKQQRAEEMVNLNGPLSQRARGGDAVPSPSDPLAEIERYLKPLALSEKSLHTRMIQLKRVGSLLSGLYCTTETPTRRFPMSRVPALLIGYLGIDVAKDKLDVVMRCDGKETSRLFANTPSGFEHLQRWLHTLHVCQIVACLEATGSYSDALARFLSEQGYTVGVLNPAVLVAYRASKQQRSKTDKADAALLAHYASEEAVVPFQPLPAEVSTLRLLLERRDPRVAQRES